MLWSELKFAVRGLIGAPGLSAATVVALALGIEPNIVSAEHLFVIHSSIGDRFWN
jgi:hypothetical protein